MSDEKQVAIKKEAGLPSSILFEDDAAHGCENVRKNSFHPNNPSDQDENRLLG